jgi:Cu+-exporting ATPase
VLLDKTGTVTSGEMVLTAVGAVDGEDPAVVLRLAGAVEHAAEHPIARAIATAALTRSPVTSGDGSPAPLPTPRDFAALPGLGVRGTVEGRTVYVGRPELLARHGMTLPPALSASADATSESGAPRATSADLTTEYVRAEADATGTASAGTSGGAGPAVRAAAATRVAVGWDGQVRGLLTVGDAVKETSAEAVSRLRALGLRPVLLTGDNAAVAHVVAAEVGIPATDVIAGVLPEEKVAVVRRLQGEGRRVAMVGDGVNDAAALAQADLGLAMGTGTDAAIAAADLTLVRGDLRVAADAIRLARRTLGTIRANLAWAFLYNTAALPLAALGLLNPMIAGAAMASSSVFVVANSLRLRRFS